jgi:hypothetical protein
MNKETEEEILKMVESLNEIFKGVSLQKVYAILFSCLETTLEIQGISADEARKTMNKIYEIYAESLKKIHK